MVYCGYTGYVYNQVILTGKRLMSGESGYAAVILLLDECDRLEGQEGAGPTQLLLHIGNTRAGSPPPPRGPRRGYSMPHGYTPVPDVIQRRSLDRADRTIADWTVSFKTGRWYMQLFFRAVDTAVHNMFIIASFWTKDGHRDARYSEIYEEYVRGKHTYGSRNAFQLRLGKALIEFAVAEALKEVGGDRSRVRRLSQIQVSANQAWAAISPTS